MQTGRAHPRIRGRRASDSAEYQCWRDMRSRCERRSHPAFKDYGERGISICERWRTDFWAFFQDMGERPSEDHSLDREDNDGNYEPSNCRWATAAEQMSNTRRNIFVETPSGTLTAAQADRAGVINAAALAVANLCRRNAGESAIGQRSSHRRGDVLVKVDGEQVRLVDYCRAKGVDVDLVYARLRYGWDLESAVNRPVRPRKRRGSG